MEFSRNFPFWQHFGATSATLTGLERTARLRFLCSSGAGRIIPNLRMFHGWASLTSRPVLQVFSEQQCLLCGNMINRHYLSECAPEICFGCAISFFQQSFPLRSSQSFISALLHLTGSGKTEKCSSISSSKESFFLLAGMPFAPFRDISLFRTKKRINFVAFLSSQRLGPCF